jgi:hypothetical protein
MLTVGAYATTEIPLFDLAAIVQVQEQLDVIDWDILRRGMQ